MAYFEYEFTDNITVRGEFVSGAVDYNTRLYAPGFNDFYSGAGLVDDRFPIAIGSNPGNPFRAFADGSTITDYIPSLMWDPNDNNTFLPPGTQCLLAGRNRPTCGRRASPPAPTCRASRTATRAAKPAVWGGGSSTWNARPTRQLDFVDVNRNGRYDYLMEPGELLVFGAGHERRRHPRPRLGRRRHCRQQRPAPAGGQGCAHGARRR